MNKKELLTALKGIKPALAQKTVIARADHYVLADGRIAAYNDSICISYPLPLDIECTVPAEEFLAAVEAFNDDEEIEVKLNKEKNLELTAPGTKAEIAIADVDDKGVESLIHSLQFSALKFKKTASNFIQGLDWCRYSADKHSTEDNFHCICIRKDKMYGTDTFRLTRFELDKAMKDFLIPAKNVNSLIKQEFDEYAIADNWVHFRKQEGEGHLIFSSVILPMDYPEYDDILDEFEGAAYSYPAKKETIDLLKKVTPLCKGDFDAEKVVNVDIRGGKKDKGTKITISAVKENAKLQKKITSSEKPPKEPLTFSINPIFLSEVLSTTSEISVATDKLMFSTEQIKHVVSLFLENTEEDEE